jgi:DNA-binding protein H-NS
MVENLNEYRKTLKEILKKKFKKMNEITTLTKKTVALSQNKINKKLNDIYHLFKLISSLLCKL